VGFTLLHYSCIVRFPFFCSCFYHILSLKVYVSYQSLQSTIKISQLILHFEIETITKAWFYITHCCHKWHQQIVWFKFWNYWLKWVFFYTHHRFYGQILFYFPISCMKWFLSPIKNLYKELVTVCDGFLLTKWKSMWRELLNIFVNGVKHYYISTRVHTICTQTHVYSLTWLLSNNLNMLRANRNFDIIYNSCKTKLGSSIICIRD
jgi:hypothetical protein